MVGTPQKFMILIYIFLLLLCSAWFSGMEIALFSLSPGQAKAMSLGKKKNSQLLHKILSKKTRLLATLLLGNNLVNIGAASLATVWAIEKFGSAGAGIATGTMTLLILIFGEMYPKTWFHLNAPKVALFFAPWVSFLEFIFFPVIFCLEKLLKILTKNKKQAELSETEFLAFSRLAVEKGIIDFSEHQMIANVLAFNDKEAKTVMTPFYRAEAVSDDAAIDQIAYFMAKTGLSRYPVYHNDWDNIIGYVHVMDVMLKLNSKNREDSLEDLVKPILMVEESTKIDKIFAKMQKQNCHIAIVKKSTTKQIIGLLTMEDLLEELVGEEIEDEKIRFSS